jgi:hypothetical protein
MKFILIQSLFQDTFGKKFKKFENSVRSCNAAQNRFVPCRISGPLGLMHTTSSISFAQGVIIDV